MITYLTDIVENSKQVGALRVFVKDKIIDIYPRRGRSIIFLSEELEHQVMPIFNPNDKNYKRFALTIWFNAISNLKLDPVKMNKVSKDDGKIFVGIPCYRDKELLKTLKSIIMGSKKPERLVFGVFLQVDAKDDIDLIQNLN